MAKPVVAIVGRPNVGKSAFFNFITGKRISIVEDTPGVTRDRIYSDAEWLGRTFTLIDTGGIDTQSVDQLFMQMRAQAEMAIKAADVIIFLVDVKAGLTASDKEVAQILYRSGKPVLLVINKVDQVGELPADIYEFYNLGLGDIYPVSSLHGLGMGDLLDALVSHFPEPAEESTWENAIRVAIIGKPNSGKSSLLNAILGEERAIVSEIPGTTRDALDTHTQRGNRTYVFIDTAGMRRKANVQDDIEYYSNLRALQAIERSDVCILLIDAKDGVTEQDTKIAGYAHEQGKGVITAVNKWDLVEKDTSTFKVYVDSIRGKFPFMPYTVITSISAKTGKRVEGLFNLIHQVDDSCRLRISTGVLNDIVNQAVACVQPPTDKGKRLKIYYITQVGIQPPTFVLFVNDLELLHFSYERYLENQLREAFGFEGTPIRFLIKERDREEM